MADGRPSRFRDMHTAAHRAQAVEFFGPRNARRHRRPRARAEPRFAKNASAVVVSRIEPFHPLEPGAAAVSCSTSRPPRPPPRSPGRRPGTASTRPAPCRSKPNRADELCPPDLPPGMRQMVGKSPCGRLAWRRRAVMAGTSFVAAAETQSLGPKRFTVVQVYRL